MDRICLNLLLSTASLIYFLSSCTSAHKSPSKLLSLSTTKTDEQHLDSTLYFESTLYDLNIPQHDDISTIDIGANSLTISTYLNDTYLFINTPHLFTSSVTLHYDSPQWTEIYANTANTPSYDSHRRRLSRWNVAKWKGRYVADGIQRNFKDAQATCQHLYGELASIMSKQEEEEVKDLCAMWNLGNCWIGYKKPWGHWEDGRRPTYLHWKPGEPNNYGGNEGCAEIHTSGQWNDVKCKLSRVAICERPRIHVVGHYVAVMRRSNWWDANNRCLELFSTTLATIENARENIMVRRACAAISHVEHKGHPSDCWIGLHRPFRTWADGEDAKVTNWADGEPNNAGGNENCAALTETQRWNDANCHQGKYFVCNTITQAERVKKRMETKRKREEREAELEKKRKKMEDQIMERYMQQNQNSQLQQMQSGGSLMSGFNSPMGKMQAAAYGNMNPQQMYQMGSRQGQQQGSFNQLLSQKTGSMGGVGSGAYNSGGLDSGSAVSELSPEQMDRLYGSLGKFNQNMMLSSNGGPPQVNLVGRRLMVDDVYGKKCVIVEDKEVCVSHSYVKIRKYVDGERKKMNKNQMFDNITVDYSKMGVDYRGYEDWKYNKMMRNKDDGRYEEKVQYLRLREVAYDADGENKQCFVMDDAGFSFDLCLILKENAMIMMVNDDMFMFDDNTDWKEIESIKIEKNPNKNIMKCTYIDLKQKEAKICIQQTCDPEKDDNDICLYKASAQFLAASDHINNAPYNG